MFLIGGMLLARELAVVAQPAADSTATPSESENSEAIPGRNVERRTWGTCAICVSSGGSNEYERKVDCRNNYYGVSTPRVRAISILSMRAISVVWSTLTSDANLNTVSS